MYIISPGDIITPQKFRTIIKTKIKECIFCKGMVRAIDFYMINKDKPPEEIAGIWNDPKNKFYCSDCYLDNEDIENNLITPYNGLYATDLFIEDLT